MSTPLQYQEFIFLCTVYLLLHMHGTNGNCDIIFIFVKSQCNVFALYEITCMVHLSAYLLRILQVIHDWCILIMICPVCPIQPQKHACPYMTFIIMYTRPYWSLSHCCDRLMIYTLCTTYLRMCRSIYYYVYSIFLLIKKKDTCMSWFRNLTACILNICLMNVFHWLQC